MNYFSHYYFDHIHDTELHNFGLLLPDMVRNFVKGKKLMPDDSPEAAIGTEWLRIGSNKHFERDKKFHGSEYFKETSGDLTQLLRPVFREANIPRDWFAAHVLTEMMLDRVLIRENPEMAEKLYADTQNADAGIIDEFLKNREIETQLFFDRLTRFNQAKYLLQYVHNKAMVYSLNRIFMLTGADGEWTEAQFEKLQPWMDDAEHLVLQKLQALKEEME